MERPGHGRRAATAWRRGCRRRPRRPGSARPDSGPRNAWSWIPTSYSPSTETSAGASGSPCRMTQVADDVRARIVAVAVTHRRPVRVERLLLGRALRGSMTGSSGSYSTADLLGRPARLLRVLRRDERDRLAEVADAVDREHGLVGELEPVQLLARDVVMREHGVDTGHRKGLGDVDRDDAGMRVRAADRVPPEHPRRPQVAGVGELGPWSSAHRRRAGRPRRSGRPRAAGAPWSRPLSRCGPSALPHPGGEGFVTLPATRHATISRPGSRVRDGPVPSPRRFLHRRERCSLPRRLTPRPPAGPRRRSSAYPVQRQRLPDSASRISSSLGLGTRASRSAVATTRPGVQKPHCTAPASTNAACTGCSSSSSARPSTVTTAWPSACAASTRQAQTSVPSSRTEHEPHSPCSHAFFEPGSPSRSRSA